MSSSAMWYKDGIFYDVPDTHINFFLQNPELLGFTQQEKKQMCIENGLPPDTTDCQEYTNPRVDILLEVMKRGAIRIRFYGGDTSVQCYSKRNKRCFQELKNCVLDGYGKVFGKMLTVMDTKGWGEYLNDMGWGPQIKDFVAASTKRPCYRYKKVYSKRESPNVISGKMLS